MILVVVALALGLADAPASDALTCESGLLVQVRTLERSEGPAGGSSPATKDERPPSSGRGALYFLSFRCKDRTWHTRVAQGAPGLRREDLRARRDVVFRVEDRTLYVKRRDGTELALQVSSPGGTAEGEQPPE